MGSYLIMRNVPHTIWRVIPIRRGCCLVCVREAGRPVAGLASATGCCVVLGGLQLSVVGWSHALLTQRAPIPMLNSGARTMTQELPRGLQTMAAAIQITEDPYGWG